MTKRILPIFLAVLILAVFFPLQAEAAQMESEAQYTVTVTSDIGEKLVADRNSVPVGETLCFQVMISASDVSAYNAYDLRASYDAARLTFLADNAVAADTLAEITGKDGHIRVKGYGDDKSFSVPAVTVQFETKAQGIAELRLFSAYIDSSGNAGFWNAAKAALVEATAEVKVEGYKVILNSDAIVTDYQVAYEDEDVTFTLEDTDLYTYDITVTIGGTDVSEAVTYDEETGVYTIPAEQIETNKGIVEIFAEPSCREFTVTITGEDVTGEEKAQYNTDYVFQLEREEGYLYTIEITIGGEAYTEFSVAEDVYTIPGADITGDITINVTKTEDTSNQLTVTFAGAGAKDGSGQKTTERGVEYPFQIKQKKGYTYSLAIYVDGKRTPYDYDPNLDTYYILADNVTGNIVIVIGKVATIEIAEYITLDKQNMYLIIFNGNVGEGEVPKYDGRTMYWSDRYNAYAWLVTSSDTVKKVKTAAEEKITLNEGTAADSIDYSGNVNGTLPINAEDARLVWEMYEGRHSLDFMEMQKLLSADVYSDKKLNVRDVAVIMENYS